MQILILNTFLFIWTCFLLYSFTTWIKFNSFSLPELGNSLSHCFTYSRVGTQWRSWWRYCSISRKVAGSIPDWVMGISHYAPVVDSASNRNEYQRYLLGGEGDRWLGLTNLPNSCADCLESVGVSTSWSRLSRKSGSFNLLEPIV